MSNYPLASSTWDEKEIAAIHAVIESDRFTMGSYVAEYERSFAQFFGARHAVMVSSGSAANLLMVGALFYTKNEKLRLKRGDEVIVPAVSWSTTYFPLQQYGLKVKFVDIDRTTLNIDLEALESAVTENTRAIFAVNLLGNPNDFKAINEIIGDRNIVLIEDNCESMGAEHGGRQAGTFGVMGSFSSFFSHHIGTMEGGCIVTDDEELYHVLVCLRAHGWTRDLPTNNHVSGLKSSEPFEESFKFVLPGYNVRPLEMSGAIGIEQLKKLPDFLRNRKANAKYFQELFSEHPLFTIQQETGSSSWFGFALLLRPGERLERRTVVEALREAKVECRPIVTGNFVKNEVVRYFDYSIHGALRNSDYIDANGLFVGNHQYDIREKIDYLFAILKRL